MRALVVYESQWGNTEQVARAIATELHASMQVELVDSDNAPTTLAGFDLVCVGGPTHAFSMTRASTRADAVTQHGAPRAPTRGIREWLADLDRAPGVKAATFDTRVDKPRLPGSAARAAKHELRSHGCDIIAKQQSFRVHGYDGPLLDGELDRATDWARQIAGGLNETVPA